MRHSIFSLLLILFLIYPIQSQSANFVFNVKGLTAKDRAQWEKDNMEELYKLGYTSWNDNRKDRYFRNVSFKNKFGDREDYNILKGMSPEQRDSLYLNTPDDDVENLDLYKAINEYKQEVANNSIIHKTMMNLEHTDFYYKSFLIIICGIIFIRVLKALARRTSQQELSFSKKQKVAGSILMVIGAFSILLSIIMFISSSYPENELTKYGYELSNRYNDSIIRPSDANLIWGYNTPFLTGIFSSLYGGICLLGWGIYVRNHQKSIIPLWKKVCKVIGYVLLTSIFMNCSEFHYFDIWEFIPKLFLIALSVLFIKIGSEKQKGISNSNLSIKKKARKRKKLSLVTSIFKSNITWTNKKAYNLYRYIKATIVFDIMVAFILITDLLDTVGGEIGGTILIIETVVKNSLILLYLRKKASMEYSEDYLVPQWFKSKFYKYLNNRAELRTILLFLYMPLFYVIPLPFGTFAIVFYIIPVCLLIGAYIVFKWIRAGKNESL